MPRPCKRRRICAMPGCERFGPSGGSGEGPPIVMTLDEFEAIRLIDLAGMNQEACAEQMNVARTTAQAIYLSARRKLAQCLVEQRELHIRGGEYVLCQGQRENCSRPCGRCWKKSDITEEEK